MILIKDNVYENYFGTRIIFLRMIYFKVELIFVKTKFGVRVFQNEFHLW